MRSLPILLLFALAGCDAMPRDPEGAMPRDPEGTLERVQASGRMRVAMVTLPPGDRNALGAAARPIAVSFLQAMERRTGARWEGTDMAADDAMAALDSGTIDIAIGPFAKKTPWETHAAFGPPLAGEGRSDASSELKPVVRNGENRWLMLVEQTARDEAER